jgi:hypothetical protein
MRERELRRLFLGLVAAAIPVELVAGCGGVATDRRDAARRACTRGRRLADRKLDTAARHRVRKARRSAAEQVMQELAYQPSPALASVAGVPKSNEARGLAAALTERLWS